MRKVKRLPVSQILFAALNIGLILAGSAQAQLDAFAGKFTLTTRVQWDKTILQPGDYTVTIASSSLPISALVRDGKGRPVARFVGGIDAGRTGTGNALLIKEKGGQLCVYGLALGSLRRTLVYDPVLAGEAVMEASVPQSVPVMLSKR